MSVRSLLSRVLADYETATGEPLHALKRALAKNAKRNAAARARYKKNPKKKIKQSKKWNQSNPDKKAANDARWRADHGTEAVRQFRQRQKAAEHAQHGN